MLSDKNAVHLYVIPADKVNVLVVGWGIEFVVDSTFANGIDPPTAGGVTFAMFVTIRYIAAVGALFACIHLPSPRKYAFCWPVSGAGTRPVAPSALAAAGCICPAHPPSPLK